MAQVLPPKKEVTLKLLEQSSVLVHLDPRRPGVVVPKWFQKQPQLVLQVGLNMAVPIPDLNIGDQGITCTLSFSRAPFFCSLPWSAIYAVVGEDGRGMMWPDDVPPEVAAQARAAARAEKKRARPQLRSVGAPDDDAPVEPSAPSPSSERAAPPPADGVEPPPGVAALGARPKAVPALAAVPSAAALSAEAQAAPAEDHAEEPPPYAAGAERISEPPPDGGEKSRKKLPPYLRVVK